MNRVKKLALAALAALVLAAGAASAPQLAGDPSQWGVAKRGSFDLTVDESVAKKGSFDITEVDAG